SLKAKRTIPSDSGSAVVTRSRNFRSYSNGFLRPLPASHGHIAGACKQRVGLRNRHESPYLPYDWSFALTTGPTSKTHIAFPPLNQRSSVNRAKVRRHAVAFSAPSLRHPFPCFRRKSYNFWFILTPSSNCFVDPSLEAHVERSKNGVPYASLTQFARSLLIQQCRSDIADFIDGMVLDIEWGARHIDFKAVQRASDGFIKLRNQRLQGKRL
ncbi:hypothetical protein N657DRAFT_307068, partial [Parathielavia appendiculata]